MNHRNIWGDTFVVATILLCTSRCLAHSGVTFIAEPVRGNITIDGDLADWQQTTEYKISVPYLFNGNPESKDYTGRFRVACDYDREVLYVGVEVTDDSINLESAIDMWNSRDACEIFLTLEHSRRQRVPLQFVYRQTPIVAEADEPNKELQESFTVARKLRGNQLTYEWRINLTLLPGGKGSTRRPAVFGFDVGYIDLDEGGDIAVFSSSPGSGKHLTSATLGDLIMTAKTDALVTIEGDVKQAPSTGDDERNYPPVAIRSSEMPRIYLQVPCNDSGQFGAKLPPGKYTASLVDTPAVHVSEEESVSFAVTSGEPTITLPSLRSQPLPKPNLIGEQGVLLHEQFDAEQVDRFVRAYMAYHKIPGLSLAIVKDGEVVFGKGFGVKSLVTSEPVTDSTVFEVASMTKPMFAYAVCRLAERGIIDLDAPLWKYLPYADIEHDDRYKKITARMVLCHRTGFPNWRDGQLKIHFEPGTQQRYSGEAFGYLAKVASHLTGKDIETLMIDEVFAPLSIDNTFLTWDENADDSLVAMPHGRNNFALRKSRWSDVWVAGCLHVDAANFAKFIQAIIHEEGLSAASYEEMLRPQVDIPDGSNDQNFSLGFVVGGSKLDRHYGHGGHNTGFTSAFEVFKDRKFGYVFMVNNYQAPKFHEDLKAFLVSGAPVSQ